MKKIILSIGIIGLLSGCASDNAQTASRAVSSQNSVEAALQAGVEGQTSSETDLSETETSETETSEAGSETSAEITQDEQTTESAEASAQQEEGGLVDLSTMNATMVYSEVFAMMTEPEQYMGKTIKMTGVCNKYTDVLTGADYYACIISDAAACCSQGIEFQLPSGIAYPESGENITVVGTFGSYTEAGSEYYVLLDSQLL